jgi:hypothetical protein
VWLATDATLHAMASSMDPATIDFDLLQGSTTVLDLGASAASTPPLSPAWTFAVFVAGLAPFAIATVEFWRRVAMGLPFGTLESNGCGDDDLASAPSPSSVIITMSEDKFPNRLHNRRRVVLGRGAVVLALALFVTAAAVLVLVAAALLTSSPMSAEMLPPT